MKNISLYIIMIIILVGTIVVAQINYDDCVIYGNCPSEDKPAIFQNVSYESVNSSDFWDNLDIPSDILGSLINNDLGWITTHSLQDAYDDGSIIQTTTNPIEFNLTNRNMHFIINMPTLGISGGFRVDGEGETYFEINPNVLFEDGAGGSVPMIQSRFWIPSADATYDFGIPTRRWRNGYFSGNITGSNIVLNAETNTISTSNLEATQNITADGVICDSNGCIGEDGGNITINNSLNDANSQARIFFEDGVIHYVGVVS